MYDASAFDGLSFALGQFVAHCGYDSALVQRLGGFSESSTALAAAIENHSRTVQADIESRSAHTAALERNATAVQADVDSRAALIRALADHAEAMRAMTRR